ncbi:MAG: RNA 2'-phosphotransferase [Thermoplasmata archaeon]|nr:RNA 2'-phosphotransferase [Thermoplasmata archaeon]
MLRECKDHGYFRESICPLCGEEGRFLMDTDELESIGRTMAGTLRHFPEKFELNMDPQGFVDLKEFIGALQRKKRRLRWLRPHHIIAIIETDPKGRYEYREGRIRATYGHSIDVDLDLPTSGIPDALYYPTTQEEVDIVLETGLKPSDRKKVHLSKTYQDATNAGKVRTPTPVILEIDTKKAQASGITIQKAGKTVYIVESIPAEFISKAPEPEIQTVEESEVLPENEGKD